MQDFELCLPTKIVFGKGKISLIGSFAKDYGKKLLLVYGMGSIKKNGVYETVIKSLREISSIIVDGNRLNLKAVFTDKNKLGLIDTYLYQYIINGEKQKYHLHPTCKARNAQNREWFCLNEIKGDFLFNMSTGDRYLIPINDSYLIDARLYAIKTKKSIEKNIMVMVLNTTYLSLFFEIEGRPMTGNLPLLDLKVYELERVLIVNPKLLNNLINNRVIYDFTHRKINNIFTECGFNKDLKIRSQEPNPLPDRKAIDDIIFDILGLTEEERKEVYWSVCELVQNRLKKARSV